jgi:hypothetical protein
MTTNLLLLLLAFEIFLWQGEKEEYQELTQQNKHQGLCCFGADGTFNQTMTFVRAIAIRLLICGLFACYSRCGRGRLS